MTAHETRPKIPESTVVDSEMALTCKTIGGVLIVLCGLISVWIPIGIRAGSYFWLMWIVVQGMIGMAFFLYGLWLEHQATSRVGSIQGPPSQSHT